MSGGWDEVIVAAGSVVTAARRAMERDLGLKSEEEDDSSSSLTWEPNLRVHAVDYALQLASIRNAATGGPGIPPPDSNELIDVAGKILAFLQGPATG